jgi:hypothetical protein
MKLQTKKFNAIETLDDIILNLDKLATVCDGRSMDGYLARELIAMSHELGLVKADLLTKIEELKFNLENVDTAFWDNKFQGS